MMTTLEIVEPPLLNAKQGALLDVHSALNALQAVYGEIYLIGLSRPELGGRLDRFGEAITGLKHRLFATDQQCECFREILRVADPLDQELREIASSQEFNHPRSGRSTAALQTILGVVRVRILELIDRQQSGCRWEHMPIDTLVSNLTDLFRAIAEHSNGRFGIAYDRDAQRANDYLIEIRVESRRGDSLFLPPELPDVIRDLSANARKYTAPGGTVSVHLCQRGETLECAVRDTGIGIPADEIAAVVQFGQRGSNVGAIRTLGGGFGLTKAVSLVKGWGGRFWISSEIDVGTEVRFEIPTVFPVAARPRPFHR